MKRKLGRAVWVVGVAAGLLCAASWFGQPLPGQEKSPAGGSSTNPDKIVLRQCRIKLIDRVILASDQPGILEYVEPEEGDLVRAGQVVAKLKDDVARAAYEIAKKKAENDVQVRYARKAAELAQAEFMKAMEANRQVPGAVPDIEVRRLKLAWEKSRLSIELADHEFAVAALEAKQAEAQLEMYRIKAPWDGIVTQIYKRKGEAVRQGDPILEMARTDRVRVEGRVSINDVWRVKPGMAVQVQLDIPGIDLPEEHQVFEGRVVFVDVAVQPVTRDVRVWARVANHDNILKDGLTATMTIDVSQPVARVEKR